MTHKEYVDSIKSIALEQGKKAVMRYLTAKFPILALNFINPLSAMLVGYILDIAIKETEIGLFFSFIDLRTFEQGKDFELAAYKYKIALEGRDENEKLIAERNLINSFNALIKFTS